MPDFTLVDSHAHLHFDKFAGRENEVLNDARQAGVTKIINVGCSVEDSHKAVAFAKLHEGVWASVGAHPHDGQDFMHDSKESLAALKVLAQDPKVVAIGEIGLDYFHSHSTKSDQEKALRLQLELGLELNKPFIFHVREAWDDFWKITRDYPIKSGVVHSFSANRAQVDNILSEGFYIGLNGIMTFTKNIDQLDAAKSIPLDKLLLETDAPFLTPTPFRGKVCESKHIAVIADFLADLRSESLQTLATQTTANANNLFKFN